MLHANALMVGDQFRSEQNGCGTQYKCFYSKSKDLRHSGRITGHRSNCYSPAGKRGSRVASVFGAPFPMRLLSVQRAIAVLSFIIFNIYNIYNSNNFSDQIIYSLQFCFMRDEPQSSGGKRLLTVKQANKV